MARQFVVVALVFFAVVGFACAATPAAESPKASATNPDVGALLAPGADNEIGNIDGAEAPGAAGGDDAVVEGPVGGPGAAGAGFTPAEAPQSGASAVEFSAVAAVAAVAGVFFF